MAKKAQPSETEDTPLPTKEAAPSEPAAPVAAEEETKPPEGKEPEAKVQEAEKPDLRTLLGELPDEERNALFEEHFEDRLQRTEQSAQDRAYARMQADQNRQVQANKALQDTLKNLDAAEDDNKRAGHIQAYADSYVQGASQQWAQEALENLRESLGVSREEHDEIVLRLHQQAARENRVATFGDYTKQVTGERFMPKKDVNKEIRAEVDAALAERQGKNIESQPAPVSTGQGEPSDQEAADNRILADPRATGEQKADAFERLYGYRPRHI